MASSSGQPSSGQTALPPGFTPGQDQNTGESEFDCSWLIIGDLPNDVKFEDMHAWFEKAAVSRRLIKDEKSSLKRWRYYVNGPYVTGSSRTYPNRGEVVLVYPSNFTYHTIRVRIMKHEPQWAIDAGFFISAGTSRPGEMGPFRHDEPFKYGWKPTDAGDDEEEGGDDEEEQ